MNMTKRLAVQLYDANKAINDYEIAHDIICAWDMHYEDEEFKALHRAYMDVTRAMDGIILYEDRDDHE